jgi:RNA polymerase sigma-B factor
MGAVLPPGADPTREALVESHLPLVQSLARRFASSGEPLDDLIQVGSVGLVKAANRFDAGRGVAFAAFATRVIEGEIRHHLRDRCAPTRIPRDLQRASGDLRRQRDRLTATSGHTPSTRELAASLHIDEELVQRALKAELARTAVSLRADEETGEGRDEQAQALGSEERLLLARSMRALDERERKVIFLRFHADLTERQIGRELGISQAQVSRVLSAALARLRAELEGASGAGEQSDSNVNTAISPDLAAVSALEDARKTAQRRAVPRAPVHGRRPLRARG